MLRSKSGCIWIGGTLFISRTICLSLILSASISLSILRVMHAVVHRLRYQEVDDVSTGSFC